MQSAVTGGVFCDETNSGGNRRADEDCGSVVNSPLAIRDRTRSWLAALRWASTEVLSLSPLRRVLPLGSLGRASVSVVNWAGVAVASVKLSPISELWLWHGSAGRRFDHQVGSVQREPAQKLPSGRRQLRQQTCAGGLGCEIAGRRWRRSVRSCRLRGTAHSWTLVRKLTLAWRRIYGGLGTVGRVSAVAGVSHAGQRAQSRGKQRSEHGWKHTNTGTLPERERRRRRRRQGHWRAPSAQRCSISAAAVLWYADDVRCHPMPCHECRWHSSPPPPYCGMPMAFVAIRCRVTNADDILYNAMTFADDTYRE